MTRMEGKDASEKKTEIREAAGDNVITRSVQAFQLRNRYDNTEKRKLSGRSISENRPKKSFAQKRKEVLDKVAKIHMLKRKVCGRG